MNFRSIADLNEDILNWIPNLPRNIELVVGIPRSGLLVANLLSLHLNIPMTDLHGFLAGRILSSGDRLSKVEINSYLQTPRKVLVVDDAVGSLGKQMGQARRNISAIPMQHTISYAALYVATHEQQHKLDYSFKRLPLPCLFEWNIFHHSIIPHTCIDIDGVLCRDPEEYEDDDGPIYEQFLRTTKPIRIPTVPIGWLVTCRLEKYRAITTEWLQQNSIRFRNLVMMNYPNKKSRQRAAADSSFKAHIYKTTGARLFIESSKQQAQEIAQMTGRYVFCTSSHTLIEPHFLGRVAEKVKEEVHKTRTYPILRLRAFLKLLRWWITKT